MSVIVVCQTAWTSMLGIDIDVQARQKKPTCHLIFQIEVACPEPALGCEHFGRVGQNQIFIRYTVYIRYFWQETHHTYGHIRCVYTVLANPTCW